MTPINKPGLFDALLAVQKEAPQLRKDAKADTGKFSYTYLSLEALLSAVLPVLHAHDVVLVQSPSCMEGLSTLKTVLHHVPSGESFEDTMLLLGTGDSQAQGSAITYARRYSLMSMLGLAAEDDDGHKASQPPRVKAQGNGDGFVPPTGKPITQARRKKLDALIDQLVSAEQMKPEHVEAWSEKRGVTYATLTTGLADELEASLLKLAKTAGVA